MKKFYFTILLLSLFGINLNAQITFRGCTTNALGDQDFILSSTSTTNDAGSVRNTFETSPTDFAQSCPAGVCELRIIWNISNSRWEIQLDNDGPIGSPDYTTSCLYYNSTASLPNPPDLTLGSWIDCSGGICPSAELVKLTGEVQSSTLSINNYNILHPKRIN